MMQSTQPPTALYLATTCCRRVLVSLLLLDGSGPSLHTRRGASTTHWLFRLKLGHALAVPLPV